MSDLLHYEDRGRGPCVVFLHPTPVDHFFWQHRLDVFDQALCKQRLRIHHDAPAEKIKNILL